MDTTEDPGMHYCVRPGMTTWSITQIATELFGGSTDAARKFVQRSGLQHQGTKGPRDARLYDAQQVREAYRDRPGRGHRSDRDSRRRKKP